MLELIHFNPNIIVRLTHRLDDSPHREVKTQLQPAEMFYML